MTTPTALLDRCRALNIRLWVEDGRLRFDAPRDALDAALRAELIERKAELIALMTPPVLPSAPDPWDRLVGPYRTPRGTLAWSDPDAPPLDLFDAAVPLPHLGDLLQRSTTPCRKR